MKRFIKEKITNQEETNHSPPNMAPGSPQPTDWVQTNKVNSKNLVQPPIPLEPPPSDSPPDLTKVKEEIVDPEYNGGMSTTIPNEEAVEPEKIIKELNEDDNNNDKPKPTVCRDFIRGNCSRPGTCRFAHEFDVSQLEGVYTFCKNFQNSGCTLPNCRYVHATVFEQQRFYRTGILPPTAFAHHKKTPIQLMPPPPPPPPLPPPKDPPATPATAKVITSFTNPPPALHTGMDKPMPVVGCAPAVLGRPPSPLKREWSEIDAGAARDSDSTSDEQPAKKCPNCDVMEFRLQHNKDKVNRMIRSTEELKNKTGLLHKKNQKLYTVLLTLLKPTNSMKGTGGLSSFNISDSEKTILDHLNNYSNTRPRVSVIGEANKSYFGGSSGGVNIAGLMAKLLHCSADTASTADSTRDA